MELTLPTKVNVTHPIMLDTKILVVIGANGAGKKLFWQRFIGEICGSSEKEYPVYMPYSSAMTNLNYRLPMNSHVYSL